MCLFLESYLILIKHKHVMHISGISNFVDVCFVLIKKTKNICKSNERKSNDDDENINRKCIFSFENLILSVFMQMMWCFLLFSSVTINILSKRVMQTLGYIFHRICSIISTFILSISLLNEPFIASLSFSLFMFNLWLL